jgi:hypothetical protein
MSDRKWRNFLFAPGLPAKIKRFAPSMILLLVCSLKTYPLLIGQWPLVRDYTIHHARSWTLAYNLREENCLIHCWSHFWAAGYPTSYHYPVGADFLGALLSGFSTDPEANRQALGFVVWATWCLLIFSTYRLGSSLVGRGPALLAALWLAMQQGGAHQGGSWWILTIGVWPSALSVAFIQLALDAWIRATPSLHGGRSALIVFTMAAGLILHPLGLVHLPVLLTAFALTCVRSPHLRELLPKLFAAFALALMLSMFWYGPFLTGGAYKQPEFYAWKSIPQFFLDAFQGKLLDAYSMPFNITGFAGVLAIVLMKFRRGYLIPCMLLLGVIIASNDFHSYVLRPISTVFNQMHLPRLSLFLAPFLAMGAGFTTYELGRRAIRLAPQNRGARAAAIMVVAATAGWGLFSFGSTQLKNLLLPAKTFDRHWAFVDHESFAELKTFMKRLRHDDPRFFRIALAEPLLSPAHLHHYKDMFTETGIPVYLVKSHLPAVHFRHLPTNFSPNVALDLNIRFLLNTIRQAPNPEFWGTPIQIGRWWLYEAKRWDSSLVHVDGGISPVAEADLNVVRVQGQSITFTLQTPAPVKLWFGITDFDRWQLLRNGSEVVPLESRLQPSLQSPVLMAPHAESGSYELKFAKNHIDHISYLISALGLILTVGWLIWPRRQGVTPSK